MKKFIEVKIYSRDGTTHPVLVNVNEITVLDIVNAKAFAGFDIKETNCYAMNIGSGSFAVPKIEGRRIWSTLKGE